jgi:D-arabinonate dehydratase
MKIVEATSRHLSVPLKQVISSAGGTYPSMDLLLVQIRTDAGSSGLGYTSFLGGQGARAARAFFDHDVRPLLLGADPREAVPLGERLAAATKMRGRKGLVLYVLSAVDLALWDHLGVLAGQPVFRLLGGGAAPIPVYLTGGWLSYSEAELCAEAEVAVGAGIPGYKMKVGCGDVRTDVRRVEKVRAVLGAGRRLMVDANQRFDLRAALETAEALKDLGVTWLEEPVLTDDLEALRELGRRSPVPLAAGENEYTRYGFRTLLETRALAYAQPDVQRVGGVTEWLRAATLAGAAGLPVTPHLAHELHVHLMAAAPNAFWVEFFDWAPADLFLECAVIQNGASAPPERPGFGVAFNPDALRRYAVPA